MAIGRQRALPARKQGNFRQLFAGRARDDLYARVEGVLPFHVIELQLRLSAAEQLLEGNLEIFVDFLEALVKLPKHFFADFVERGGQVVYRLLKVVPLGNHLVVVRLFVVVFLDGVGINRAEHGNFAL